MNNFRLGFAYIEQMIEHILLFKSWSNSFITSLKSFDNDVSVRVRQLRNWSE